MVTDINNVNAPQPGKPRGGTAPVDPGVDNPPSNPPATAPNTGNPGNSNNGDTVELSSQVQDLNRIRESITAQPEVDETRVNAVREQIAQGIYAIDAERIAAQILVNEQDF